MRGWMWAIAITASTAAPALAAPPFAWPADCRFGEDCWVVRYVDRDPGPGQLDVGCGELTGDGHRGTDITLADMAVLERGVAVLSPADGRVLGIRDNMPDISVDAPGAPDLRGQNCGNGVRIDHGGGWESQLCHLGAGSVAVRYGDVVAAGQYLGLIGLSGDTNFPHVHWTLTQEGDVVDPFDGAKMADDVTCATGGRSLIASTPAYEALPLVGAGMAAEPPDDDAIVSGRHNARLLPTRAPALLLWLHAYGTQPGDVLEFGITGPQGTVLQRSLRLQDGRARGSYFVGLRRPGDAWPPGDYQGDVIWRRGDLHVSRRIDVQLVAQP